MAYQFKIVRFNVAPKQAVNVIPFDENRRYFLIANSVTSLNEFYILYYNFEQTNLTSIPQDSFAIYQGGYYEPNVVPSNAISVYNNNAINTLSGFVLI